MIALPLGEDVATLRIPEDVPRLATDARPHAHNDTKQVEIKTLLKNVEKASKKCRKGEKEKKSTGHKKTGEYSTHAT